MLGKLCCVGLVGCLCAVWICWIWICCVKSVLRHAVEFVFLSPPLPRLRTRATLLLPLPFSFVISKKTCLCSVFCTCGCVLSSLATPVFPFRSTCSRGYAWDRFFGSSRFLGVFLFIYFFPRLERLGLALRRSVTACLHICERGFWGGYIQCGIREVCILLLQPWFSCLVFCAVL
jgi:hypothetical protein